MHLEPFCVRSVRVRAQSAGVIARPTQASGKQVISAIALQRILRSTYMMGQGWQLKAPNLDQCEPLRENVLPAWSAKDNGKWSPERLESGFIYISVLDLCELECKEK